MVKWLVVIHILALVVVFSAISLFFRLIITVLIIISFTHYLRCANHVGILRHSTLMGWEWFDKESGFSPIEILSSSVITQSLLVLHFKRHNHKKKAIIVCRDSLLTDKYRQLQITLKINGLN